MLNDYEHTKLRKQYYTAFNIPFCKCGGCWHYDKDINGFVCEECGGLVPIIDITRHIRVKQYNKGVCIVCGKKLKGRQKLFCSNKCTQINKHDKERETLFNTNEGFINHYRYKNIDENINNYNTEFNQNDNNWGLGESNLYEHRIKDKTHEKFYIRKEFNRIKSRKPNP